MCVGRVAYECLNHWFNGEEEVIGSKVKEQLSSLHVIILIYFMFLEIWGKVKIEEQLSSLYIAIVATQVKVEEQLSSQ